MAVQRPKKSKEDIQKYKRKHNQTIRLNDFELQALNKYCKKYKVNNRAQFIRETLMTEILRKFDEDYPTLFEIPQENQEHNQGQLQFD